MRWEQHHKFTSDIPEQGRHALPRTSDQCRKKELGSIRSCAARTKLEERLPKRSPPTYLCDVRVSCLPFKDFSVDGH